MTASRTAAPAVSHSGGCQCGRVRFTTSGDPKFTARCHCQSCRRATGGAYSTWVGWLDAQVEWRGPEPDHHASSDGVRRGFCRDCGTPLTYQGDYWAGETHILIGCFDRPSDFTPSGDAFAAEKLDWT